MTLTKRLFLSTFISLVLATGSKAQIKLQSGQKVAFLGDSITQFGWDRPGGAWRNRFAGRRGWMW